MGSQRVGHDWATDLISDVEYVYFLKTPTYPWLFRRNMYRKKRWESLFLKDCLPPHHTQALPASRSTAGAQRELMGRASQPRHPVLLDTISWLVEGLRPCHLLCLCPSCRLASPTGCSPCTLGLVPSLPEGCRSSLLTVWLTPWEDVKSS